MIRENFLTGLEVKGSFDSGNPELENLNIGIRNDWPELHSILKKTMASVSSREMRKLEQRWLGLDSDEEARKMILTNEEQNWLEKHPSVRLGVDPAWPPFDFINEEGQHDGLAADVLTLLEKKLGIKFQLAPDLTYSEVKTRIKKRDLDVVSLMSQNPERKKYLKWSKPIATIPMVVASRNDFKQVGSPKDLIGNRVVVAKGYAVVSYLRANHPDVTFSEADTPLDGLKMVSMGEADQYVGYLGTISYLIREHGLFNMKIAGPTGFPPKKLAIAVRSDWPELVSLINKGLVSISLDQMAFIREKWIPSMDPGKVDEEFIVPHQVDFNETTFIIKSIAAVFALIIAILFATWLIRGRPKQLTIREILFFVSFVFAGLIVSIGVFVTILVEGIEKEAGYDDLRNKSLKLAFELKQSSEDLTRFARTFAVTGDPVNEKYFKAIIAIRDGKRPRPKEFNIFYWDRVAAGQLELTADGEKYSIEEKILELGLNEIERNKFTLAKKESDLLVELETMAFNVARGLYKDDKGQFTVHGEPDLELARNILHGKEYHEAKARIMKPISDSYRLLSWRITTEQNLIRERNHAIIRGITALILITIVFAFYVFFSLKETGCHTTLGAPVRCPGH